MKGAAREEESIAINTIGIEDPHSIRAACLRHHEANPVPATAQRRYKSSCEAAVIAIEIDTRIIITIFPQRTRAGYATINSDRINALGKITSLSCSHLYIIIYCCSAITGVQGAAI